jgi:glycosyltransferase involved in cell wall biosynthesis
MPCFNEENSIQENVRKVIQFVDSSCPGISYEVLTVNDGSTDGTLKILTDLQSEFKQLKVLNHPFNKGRGAGMKTGLSGSTGEYVLFLDADLSYDVDHIQKVLDTFKNNNKVDAIIISPYMKGGMTKNVPFSRLLLSRFANWILSGFFSQQISTVTSMARAYRGEVIRTLPLYEDGKEIHLEILKKLHLVGANIVEIPGRLIWKEKKNRNARLNKRKVAEAAGKHLLYGFLAKPTRFLSKLAVFILLISIYEFINVGFVFLQNFHSSALGFWKDVWIGLSQTFAASPHSVVIAITTMIISIQLLSFLAIFTILKMQHEESLRHILAILQSKEE